MDGDRDRIRVELARLRRIGLWVMGQCVPNLEDAERTPLDPLPKM